MKAALVCLGAVLFGVVACGSSDGGGGSGGSANGGFNFGGASGSGASGAGSSSGGASGAAAAGAPAGGAPAGGQCSPGVTHTADNQFDQKLTQCIGYKSTASGFPTDPDITVDQLELGAPLVAGTPFAISAEFLHISENVSWELWGSDGFCGAAEEQLYKQPISTGPACAYVTPKANHNALLFVIAGPSNISYGFESITICPNGTCGK